MFLRSKVQEMILRRRSRSMNGGASAGAAQRSHVSGQPASASMVSYDGDSGGAGGAGKGAPPVRGMFGSPRLLHSSSMPAGAAFARIPVLPGATEPEAAAFVMSPTSVLDAAAAFAPPPGSSDGNRRQWRAAGLHGLADALDCAADQQQQSRGSVLAATSRAVSAPALARSFSLDRRVEFGVKNKSSWLPLRGRDTPRPDAAAAEEDGEVEMEPSSEDYTCVISRGPNPRTVHIFGDRVVESSPRPITLPACRRPATGASSAYDPARARR